jgi:2-polyprenyl-3-methyl-5-hydroxy-6-metoxy-1,4-benzoquinol methylase
VASKDRGPLFVIPSAPVLTDTSRGSYGSAATYSHYNYLRPGLIARLKRARFETALRLARPWFGAGAIDMGCADGIMLPSLSRHFSTVIGVDTNPNATTIAEEVASTLPNVRVLCNGGVSFEELRRRSGPGHRVLFLLETLEHIGDRARMYEGKADFVAECLSLLEEDGVVIASVPRMVGPLFVAKYGVQWATRRLDERHSLGELWRAGVLRDTSRLERRWNGGHLGFSHLKLDATLGARFRVHRRIGTLTSIFYIIGRRPGRGVPPAPAVTDTPAASAGSSRR